MHGRIKKITIFSIIFAALVILLFFSKNTLVSFIYHNRFFDGPPMETKRKRDPDTTIVNFKFTMADAEFINTFGNSISKRCFQWHPVNLDIDGRNYTAEICRFRKF